MHGNSNHKSDQTFLQLMFPLTMYIIYNSSPLYHLTARYEKRNLKGINIGWLHTMQSVQKIWILRAFRRYACGLFAFPFSPRLCHIKTKPSTSAFFLAGAPTPFCLCPTCHFLLSLCLCCFIFGGKNKTGQKTAGIKHLPQASCTTSGIFMHPVFLLAQTLAPQ